MERTTELSELRARQGVVLGRMRYVLAISMAMAVVAMIVAVYAG